MFTDFKNIVSEKKHGFTLLELIIVIIIVGILATLGLNQYTNIVESGRGAEAKASIGVVRKLHQQYYLANGTRTGETASDVGIGSALDQFPTSCGSSFYFRYGYFQSSMGDPVIGVYAYRCTSGGKSPQSSIAYTWGYRYNPATNYEDWWCQVSGSDKWGWITRPQSCP